MIDTIHFRVHNIKKNQVITSKLATSDNKGSSLVEVDQSIIEQYEGSKIKSIIYHDRGGVVPLVRRSVLTIPSSHYTISYSVNYQKDYIDFNCSVPKYYFATNVIQYINYFEQSAEVSFRMLRVFFEDFFKFNFVSMPDLADVEINRIDLCYNHFFNSKDQALNYLNAQKELLAKYARSSKNNFRTYDTSLLYVTRRYSFKIYHKGTEFKENDRKELLKKPPAFLERKGLSIPNLQKEADRILRYEMTFRNTGLNYIFNQDIFDTPQDKTYAPVFLRMVKINPAKAADYIDDFKGKSARFMLSTGWSEKNLPLSFYVDQMGVKEFDLMFFKKLYKRFWDKVKDYQLNLPLSPFEIKKKIEDHNKRVEEINKYAPKKKRMSPKENQVFIAALLSQHVNIQSLKAHLPDRTFYRLKADLKSLGLDCWNTNTKINPPPLDYMEYKMYFGKFHNVNF